MRMWRPKSWRFLRWAGPVTVVVLLFAVTVVAWAINRVTPADPDFLEPGSTAGVGARTAAGHLAAAGVPVHRFGDSGSALAAAQAGNATVLVTAPDYMASGYATDLFALPASDRIVLVAPSGLLLLEHGLPVLRTGSRWATGSAAAGCHDPLARGPAAVVGARYQAPHGSVCYGGGLVRLSTFGSPEVVLVGAADVLRNDRIGEHANASLAKALLAGRSSVVWLSLHRRETAYQQPTAGPGLPSQRPSDPSGATGSPQADQPGGGSTGNGRAGGPATRPPNPLASAFPAWVWAALAQLLLAAVLLALWRARRLGPPVAEPLPVTVRGSETVTGRARLYHRARARPAALDALRAGALRRLLPSLSLGADPPRAAVIAALAERANWPPDRVETALYGVVPASDDELRAAVAELDLLVRQAGKEATGA